jgi:hypothetical protein
MNRVIGSALSILVLTAAGCNRGQVASVEAAGNPPPQTLPSRGARVAPRPERTAVLPPGTTIRVRFRENVDTKWNRE